MADVFTVVSVLRSHLNGPEKTVILSATGPTTYNATNLGYTTIDLGVTEATLGNAYGFTRVYAVEQVGVGAYTSSRYQCEHTYGTTPASTKLTVRDLNETAATVGMVAASTNLSTSTFYFKVTGY